MLVTRQERTLAIDGDYIHVRVVALCDERDADQHDIDYALSEQGPCGVRHRQDGVLPCHDDCKLLPVEQEFGPVQADYKPRRREPTQAV